MDRDFPFWQMRILGAKNDAHPELDVGRRRLPHLAFDAFVETLSFPFQLRQSPTKRDAVYRLLDRIIPKSVWKSE
ncbi:MAG: hypothetical protein OXP36_06950 [Gammaproteobacteria bacterium]|nr:hypothetical protein [Gammaproteobacteria bacterium]